jgi:hypothetical protein
MGEKDYPGDHVNWMELIVKEVANAGHPILDKMQVTTILNSLPFVMGTCGNLFDT